MDIKVLGSGCARCKQVEELTRGALDDLGLRAEIDEVTDPAEIASWGVMSTPALVVDDEVVVAGRVPSRAQIADLLRSRG